MATRVGLLCVMLVSVCGGNLISELQEPPESQSRDAAGAGRADAALEEKANEVCLNTNFTIVSLWCPDGSLRAKFVSCKM